VVNFSAKFDSSEWH